MEQAVQTLYYGHSPSDRKQAEILLEKFRQSPDAWGECDRILMYALVTLAPSQPVAALL
jgi:hypothetical protein